LKDDFPKLLGETRELRKVFFESISIKLATDNSWVEEKVELIVSSKNSGLTTETIVKELMKGFMILV